MGKEAASSCVDCHGAFLAREQYQPRLQGFSRMFTDDFSTGRVEGHPPGMICVIGEGDREGSGTEWMRIRSCLGRPRAAPHATGNGRRHRRDPRNRRSRLLGLVRCRALDPRTSLAAGPDGRKGPAASPPWTVASCVHRFSARRLDDEQLLVVVAAGGPDVEVGDDLRHHIARGLPSRATKDSRPLALVGARCGRRGAGVIVDDPRCARSRAVREHGGEGAALVASPMTTTGTARSVRNRTATSERFIPGNMPGASHCRSSSAPDGEAPLNELNPLSRPSPRRADPPLRSGPPCGQ